MHDSIMSEYVTYNTNMQQRSYAPAPVLQSKRKRDLDCEEEITKHMRVRAPQIDTEGFPPAPELVYSASASDSDMATLNDQDMDFEMDDPTPAGPEPTIVEQYSYSEGGSGGFGFGPGADEDDMDSDDGTPHKHAASTSYPMLFQNAQQSAWSAQAYCTSLAAPGQATGVIQPHVSAPLPDSASAVERARNSHGPHCTSIPKLRMSDYPDAVTGERSLWAVCQDCGACERAG